MPLFQILFWLLAMIVAILYRILRPPVVAVRGTWRFFRTHTTQTLTTVAGLLFATGVLGIFFGLYYVFRYRDDMPNIRSLIEFQPPTIGQIYDNHEQTLIELAKDAQYRRIVKFNELPPILVNAILAAEDKNFFQHNGVDWWAMVPVLTRGVVQMHFRQGASTVTQQLTDRYFMHDGPPPQTGSSRWIRKLKKIRMALWLEEEFTRTYGSKRAAKEEILARYASFIYLGNSRYGFAAASEYYFDTSLTAYTSDDADKAAILAGITKSPGTYAPTNTNGKIVIARRNGILQLMAKRHSITPAQAKIFAARPIVLAPHPPVTEAQAIVKHVFAEMKKLHDVRFTQDHLFEGQIHVHTTTDLRIQMIANEALEHGLHEYEKRHPKANGLVQGSVIILRNSDDAILAEVGGRKIYLNHDNRYSDFNRVLQAKRQPGSAFKPLVYLTAFTSGATLESIIYDGPISVPMGRGIPPKEIGNYDHLSKGNIPVRQALAESRNQATMRIAMSLGIAPIIQVAHLTGVISPLEPYPSTALGASEVTLLELTNAYRAMASGISATPYLISSITNNQKDTMFSYQGRNKKLMVSNSHLAELQEGLRGVVRIPNGTAHSLDTSNFPIPIMGKTGTTSNFKDAAFCGSTYGREGITICTRVGFDNPDMGYNEHGAWNGIQSDTGLVKACQECGLGDKETGGRTALPIFREIMLKVYDPKQKILGPPPKFPEEIEQHIDSYISKITEVPK